MSASTQSHSLLTLAVNAIAAVAARQDRISCWNAGEATMKEAFDEARVKYGFVHGEFVAVVREGRELGVIVAGSFHDTVRIVSCCRCDEPASYASNRELGKVICSVCREIELDHPDLG
jgi:hypothetical protein